MCYCFVREFSICHASASLHISCCNYRNAAFGFLLPAAKDGCTYTSDPYEQIYTVGDMVTFSGCPSAPKYNSVCLDVTDGDVSSVPGPTFDTESCAVKVVVTATGACGAVSKHQTVALANWEDVMSK